MNAKLTPRQIAIQTARQILTQYPVYLDTETTGLSNSAEIVEVGIVDHDGAILFESLVRPARPIPLEVIAIHKIDNQMVQGSRAWPTIWPVVREIVLNRTIATYNADYDLRYPSEFADPIWSGMEREFEDVLHHEALCPISIRVGSSAGVHTAFSH